MDTLMWSGAGLSSEGLGMRPEAIAYLTQGGIELVEGLFNPPAPRARLRSHVRRMTGPNPPSSADIVAAERDLKWSHSQFYRIITAVNFIGAAMGAATAEPDDGVTTEERRMHDQQTVTSTVVLLALGAGLVLEPTRWSSYRSRVDAGVRLDVTPTAGGATLSARGRF